MGKRWVFETAGNEELANIVFEVVSRNGMDWIWKEDPVVDIVDIVDPVDTIDVDVALGSITIAESFGMNTLENACHRKKLLVQDQMRLMA